MLLLVNQTENGVEKFEGNTTKCTMLWRGVDLPKIVRQTDHMKEDKTTEIVI